MIHHIIQRLLNTPDVNDVTEGRIFPLHRLQGSTIPAITVQLLGTEPAETKDSPANFELHTVEITVFDENPAAAWTTATAARQALDGWKSATISEGRFVNQATDIFEATEVFSITQRYAIHMGSDLTPQTAQLPAYPPVIVTNSDGTEVEVPAGGLFICTPPPPELVKSGIFYQRTIPWENRDPGVDGSVYWHQQNGTYNYVAPFNPEYIAAKNNNYANTDADSRMLQNNAFGNRYRYTNDRGEQYVEDFHTSPDNTSENPQYCIDHYTGTAWYVQRNLQLSNNEREFRSYREGIAYANAFEYAGFNDWRLADIGEYLEAAAYNDFTNSYTNVYTPFVDQNIRQHGGRLLTGTYTIDNQYVAIISNGPTINTRTNLDEQFCDYLLLVRNHYT